MKKKIFIMILLASAMVIMPIIAAAQDMTDAQAIVKRSQDRTKLKGVESLNRLLIYDQKGRLRERSIASISSLQADNSTQNTLLRFIAPADVKGTGFLTTDYENKDDDIWLYLPALRKTRRIVSSEKAGSFMGSEFSYADISRTTISDFEYTLKGTEVVNGANCYVIEQIPVDDDVADEYGFSKKINYIDVKDFVVYKAVYFDFDDEEWKILTTKDVRPLEGLPQHMQAYHLIIENLENGRKSEMIIDKSQYSPNVDQKYFTTSFLERG